MNDSSKMIRLDEALSIKEFDEDFKALAARHLPQFDLWNALGSDRIQVKKAEACYIETNEGRRILDVSAASGCLNLGHNHPELIAIRSKHLQHEAPEVWKTFLSPYLAALSKNLASLLPEDLNYSFFCNSGSEAIEGALKIAAKYSGAKRRKVISASESMHGHTLGALSLSPADPRHDHLPLIGENIQVPFGDSKALLDCIEQECANDMEHGIMAVILEPVLWSTAQTPPTGYLHNVRRICDQYGILLILDEVSSGLGRTGALFAFMHQGVKPDILCMGKSLGGGMCSIAAYVARNDIFLKAYGSMDDSTLHTSTFNGFGEESVIASETLKLIHELNLSEMAAQNGLFLDLELHKISERYKSIFLAKHGIGLLSSLEFRKPGNCSFGYPKQEALRSDAHLKKDWPAFWFYKRLLKDHNILTNISPYAPSFLKITPPLIISSSDLEQMIYAINKVAKDYSNAAV